jgi:D-alanyl-D-alanine carboxypeptidase (penicillin-binding protein 5/6)
MEKPSRLRWKRWLSLLLIVVLIAGYGTWTLKRPLPQLTPVLASSEIKAKVPAGTLTWPTAGQAAVGIEGTSILQTNGPQTSLPTASTAKLITALSVLRQKPLAPGQQGPIITLTASDVALFNSYNAQGGSVVPVKAGEQISEYQMLQALMLPSANNMADSLAIWGFGSLNAYADYANEYVSQLGLRATHIGSDASGLAPNTTSSAHDLVKLGETAMENPVLAGIVGQPTASGLPIVGDVKNVNFLLGTKNIVGVKTGNSDEAGGVFVGAARTNVNGKPVTIVTAVLGSPTLFVAMKDSLNLINSAQANFKPVAVVKSGTVVGSYNVPWGGSIPAVAASDLSVSAWASSSIAADIHLNPLKVPARPGDIVGGATIKKSALADQKSIPLVLKSIPGKASLGWRLLHPF